jgi:DnaK suppressor protein
MNKTKLEYFKKVLLTQRARILNKIALLTKEDFAISTEDLPDETDLASSIVNQQVSFRMRERELSKLRNIEASLYRVENNTYGICEECDESISLQRLENQPWAELCITHAEERERSNSRFATL